MFNALKHSSDWILLIIIGLALTNAECTVKSAEPLSPVETLINLRRPLVIGHRGYNQIAPENTLPSFKLAKAADADMVELD
jgi:glycerophosphoryl diester phosphodiesterase